MSCSGNMPRPNPLQARFLPLRKRRAAPDHPDVSAALHKLAMTHQMQNQYAEAEPSSSGRLPSPKEAQGPDHPDVRGWLDRLASVYEAQRRYSGSRTALPARAGHHGKSARP